MSNAFRLSFSALFLVVAASPLVAQVATGTIVGVVEDATGAVVPDAGITVIHQGTQETRRARTNERGEFSVPYVRIGGYSIAVEAQGFQTQVQSGIELQVDQTVKLQFTMKVGSVSERMEVTAAAPLVDTSTSSLGQVIGNKKIVDLPLNGRNPFALGLLSGNTVAIRGMGTNLPFAAGGGRFASNDVLLDGIDNNTSMNDGSIGRAGIAYTPSVDAVEEFKVKTNNFSAEFGRSAGAVISATTKSGSNSFHGSGWEFLRNEKLDANNFFSNANRIARQPFKQNQFGATLGGPVLIPKLYSGKNRTFFFADYEGRRRRTSASSSTLDIPPMDFRQGDFSAYNQPIYDPSARRVGPAGTVISTPFPGQRIPQRQINPSSLAIVGLIPQPNAGAPGAQTRNYLRITPRPSDSSQFDVRIDQRLSDSNSFYGRFSLANSTVPDPGTFDGFIGGGSSSIRNTRSAVLNDTHVISPSAVNDFRFGYTRHNGSSIGFASLGVPFAQQNNIALFPYPVPGFPSIAFNYSGLQNSSAQFSGWGGGDSDLSIENTFHWADNINITRGNHSLKAGGEIRRYRFDAIRGGGQMIFGSIFSSSSDKPGSGAPFADFLMGFMSGTQGTQLLDWSRQRDLYTGFYIQDDWKIWSRLTLNVGLRYDLYTQPVDARDRGGLFDVATARMALPGKDGYSRAIVDGDHNNFAPRLGFAYSVSRKLTIRTGAGVFFGRRDQNQEVTQIGANIPNTPVIFFPPISANATVTPPVTINTPFRLGPSDPSLAGYTPRDPLGRAFRTPDFHNSQAPYVYQWNFNLQYQLQTDLVVEAAYSGNKGNRMVNRLDRNQIRFEDAMAGRNRQENRPFAFINNNIGFDTANGSNIYNSLNLRVEKRHRSGVNFLANYTWSKNLEANGSGSSAWTQNGGTTYPLDSYNLRKERSYAPLDVPHVFVFSGGYELPFGPGKPWLNRTGVPNHLFGGWQVNGIFTTQSGFPSDIRSNRVPSSNQLFARINVPDRVSGVSMRLPNPGVDGYFNAAAFSEPVQVRSATGVPITLFGNSARRVARGPGSSNADFSLFKSFALRESFQLQFRAEAFNLTNTPTFFLPSATNQALTTGNPNFGKLTGSSATGRQLQFGLKLVF